MIKFKITIEYGTTIDKNITTYTQNIQVSEISIDELSKHTFYTSVINGKEKFSSLSLSIIMEICLSIYNQLMLTNYSEEKVLYTQGAIKSDTRTRVKYDIAMLRKLFCYIAIMEGYTVRQSLEYLGYKNSVVHYSKLFEKHLQEKDNVATTLYTCVRKVLNKLSTQVNLYKDE